MDQGVYGHIRSTLPPLSPVAWTSLATGVSPAKHGIIGQREVDLPRNHGLVVVVHFNAANKLWHMVWIEVRGQCRLIGVSDLHLDQLRPIELDRIVHPESHFAHRGRGDVLAHWR